MILEMDASDYALAAIEKSIQSLFIPTPSTPQNSTTTLMIRNFWPSSKALSIGDNTWRAAEL
jgi:hypothetical protein